MYDQYVFESAIFYYLYRFLIPLILAEFITFIHAKKRMYWIYKFICYSILNISISCVFIYWDIDIKIGWFRTIFIFLFFLSLFPLMFSFDLKFKHLLFLSLSAYTVQNFADNLWQLGMKLVPNSNIKIIEYTLYFILIGSAYLMYYFIFVKLIKKNDVNELNNNSVMLTSIISILVINILSMYAQECQDDVGFISSKIYALIACFFILTIQYNIFHTKKLNDEKDILQQTLKFQNDKFSNSKETMDLINIKCHDLKHAIEALNETSLSKEQKERLIDLSSTVDIYDSRIKTGNSIIDMVLAEKSLICKKEKIRLTPIIEGELFSFMENVDIYSLFENIVDNAIKAIKKENEDKRAIFINAIRKNNTTIIKVENYCSELIEFENGLPLSKEDSIYHGYGTKSIDYIAKKYGGYCLFEQKNNIFSVTICFFK